MVSLFAFFFFLEAVVLCLVFLYKLSCNAALHNRTSCHESAQENPQGMWEAYIYETERVK